MFIRTIVVTISLGLAVSLAACTPSATNDPTQQAPYSLATPTVTGSPTIDKLRSAEKITIGVKEDQPGLGFKDPATGEYTGFDSDIARWVAASLGKDRNAITFKAIASSNREQALNNGQIDLYVGTYSITKKRQEMVDFAGPYFATGQGLLVRKDENRVNSEKDLAGRTVCSATGSTPIQNIRENYPQTTTTEFDVYSKCIDTLKNKQVDAVTTDEAILLGYASQDPENLKVVGEPFTTERYGVGIAKGDTALKSYLNTVFTEGKDIWQKLYDQTLGKSGKAATQPAVEP